MKILKLILDLLLYLIIAIIVILMILSVLYIGWGYLPYIGVIFLGLSLYFSYKTMISEGKNSKGRNYQNNLKKATICLIIAILCFILPRGLTIKELEEKSRIEESRKLEEKYNQK